MVFIILVIINFVVVTKGAGRISEVSARFTLDAMPGKQMAIDADLNAGMIDQDTARKRREEVGQEADFYGAMDGASKFVRGDAVAGILIMLINVLGGLGIGLAQHGLPFDVAVKHYTLLTIGDGLVAQIPSLLLSTAAAIMVTRVSSEHDMGQQVINQMFTDPRALGVAAGSCSFSGWCPACRTSCSSALAACAAIGARYISRKEIAALERHRHPRKRAPMQRAPLEVSWDDVAPVDVLGLEVGYRLIPLVDRNQGGELLARIKGVRKKLSQELGLLVPSVHIRDNLDLLPNSYRLTLMGVPVATAEIYPDKSLAIDPGEVFGKLNGIATQDPAFGLPAVWIDASHKENAQTLGYTVVDASTVIATHLNQIMQEHAAELLGHDEVQKLLEILAASAPKLAEQSGARQHVDLGSAESAAEPAARKSADSRHPHDRGKPDRYGRAYQGSGTADGGGARLAGPADRADHLWPRDALDVITLDPELEQLLIRARAARARRSPAIEPGMAERLQRSIATACERQEISGKPSVLLVASAGARRCCRGSSASVNRLVHVFRTKKSPTTVRSRLSPRSVEVDSEAIEKGQSMNANVFSAQNSQRSAAQGARSARAGCRDHQRNAAQRHGRDHRECRVPASR